ncbi:S8 family serine peptidase [Haloarchaeobius amylolyticus]|uniref:S8 family serine peptidase n=1 Tax=Haloarchaeobius amylolyticus TaxID=1198296 RepID=UPI00226FE3BE|nr:S8 family serine peptidase [Haloarchaeobius amylolyticus]
MVHRTRRDVLKVSGALLGGIAVGTTVTAASSTDRFIVRTRGRGVPKGVDVVHEMPGTDLAVVAGDEGALQSARGVKEYAPDIEMELDDPPVNADAPRVGETSVTDEPFYGLQWDKQDLDVPTAHETTKGEGTRVTIIDTGVAAGHPDLNVNEDLSKNFTGDGLGSANPAGGYHGTHVGGIVAARTDNETGVAGTAPDTDLVDCRVFSPNSLASFGDILAAVVYSASIDADVANLSLGAYPVPRQGMGSFYGKVLNSAMTYANSQGTLLVIAAGNDAADLQHDGRVCMDFDDDGETECNPVISLPNEGAQALSVSATGPVGFNWGDEGVKQPAHSPARYTNYGTNAVDLGAPGGNYDPAFPEGWYYDLVFNTIAEPNFDDDGNYLGASYSYAWLAGTSMAAPNVAGAAALVKSANPDYNANQVEAALKQAADVPEGYDKTYYGSGYLNILDAL